MKIFRNLLLLITIIWGLQACNTLYSYSLIDIEVVEPGKLMLPEKYSAAAIRYNNVTDSYNSTNNTYYKDSRFLTGTINMDSIAAGIYFASVIENLNKQFYFDSITELESADYSEIYLSDSLVRLQESDTTEPITKSVYYPVSMLTKIINETQPGRTGKQILKLIDPEYGLYKPEELKEIADSTHADLLISLDYFTSVDAESSQKIAAGLYIGNIAVYGMGVWNFYNLKTGGPEFSYNHLDTLMWYAESQSPGYAEKELPPRKDAVLNAADVMGIRMAEKLIPHWIGVQRLYYTSGQAELKKTEPLVKDGKWIEAAEIWRANVNNKNKNIAAKSMYNLGVACEMQGDLEAAVDWIVKSYHVFGNKNEIHSMNCLDYLNILGQRRFDLKVIEKQVSSSL